MIWSRSKSFKIFAYALKILFDFCKMQMLKSPKSIVSQSDLKFVKISSKLFRKPFCLVCSVSAICVRVFLSCLPHTLDRFFFFRTSAYTGAKLASRVPFWFRDLSRQKPITYMYLDISSHIFVRVISYHFSDHLAPSFIMGFNSLMLFFYVSKLTF